MQNNRLRRFRHLARMTLAYAPVVTFAAVICLSFLPGAPTAAAANKPSTAHTPPASAPAPAPVTPATPATLSIPATPTTPAASPAPASITPPMTAPQVIDSLNQTIDWYRTLGLQQQAANEPSDMLILYENRQTANRVVALAFEAARADADMLAALPPPMTNTDDTAGSTQSLLALRKKLEAQAVTVQAQLDDARHESAPTRKAKTENEAKIEALQGVLELINTKESIIATMTGFSAGGGIDSVGALKAQIDAMAVAMPAMTGITSPSPANSTATTGAAPANAGTSSSAPAAAASAASPLVVAPTTARFGLWDLGSNAVRLSEKSGTIAAIDQRTVMLQTTIENIRKPLLAQLKAWSARGDAIAAQTDSADSATLNGLHDQLEALSRQFKQASELLIPLSREGLLLVQYRRNLNNWREGIRAQYRDALETLGIRLGVLVVVLAVLFGGAEIWRRAVLRYIQDSRRRYQLLLLRRIALWSLVVVVVGFAFASELGSVVTFAGLITAGVAVAMQSVLVSIVGYFFLIGKYGIRVGDRVQIGEVAGEVIDLGLVRMYLMELGAKGAMGPTGRVVAFANSVVFQVSSGLFKQIPGVNFSWREVILNLPAGSDYSLLKEKLNAAMNGALEAYRPEILRQTQEIAKTTMSASAGDAQAQVQLHFAGSVVEAHVRYPVHLEHAAEIDERVTEALAKVVTEVAPAAPTAAALTPTPIPAPTAASTPPAGSHPA